MTPATPASDEAVVTRDGPVLTLTFNRPYAMNALTWAMYDRLRQVSEAADADDSIRVLVLRGAGGRAFAAGTDIGQFAAFRTAEDGIRYEREGDACMDRLDRVRKPVIAQVEGVATGGGLRIAAACDLRIATPEARFGAPIARTLGNCLSMAAYATFVDLFGPSRFKEMMLTARLLSAEEAHAAGFVHQIVPRADIAERVAALAAELCARASITLEVTKEAVRRIQASRRPPDGDDLIARTYESADFKEGVRAFLEKREPRWTGT